MWPLGMKLLGNGNRVGMWGGSGVRLRVPWSSSVPCPLHRSARQAACPHPYGKAAGATQVPSLGQWGPPATGTPKYPPKETEGPLEIQGQEFWRRGSIPPPSWVPLLHPCGVLTPCEGGAPWQALQHSSLSILPHGPCSQLPLPLVEWLPAPWRETENGSQGPSDIPHSPFEGQEPLGAALPPRLLMHRVGGGMHLKAQASKELSSPLESPKGCPGGDPNLCCQCQG